jgi:hypothetical protein
MPGANSTTKAEVLLRAAKLLEFKIPDFANRIHIVIEDDIPQSLQNNSVLTVQITGGQFDHGAMVGGGSNVVLYSGTLRIAIWSSNRTDRAGTGVSMLTSSGRGLLRLETKIIKALVGSYLQEVEAGGDGFTPNLIDCIKPLNDTQAQSAEKASGTTIQKGTLAVDFQVDFKWDLDGDLDNEPDAEPEP